MTTGRRVAFHRTVQGRRFIRNVGIVVGAFVLGLVVTFALYPGQLFRQEARVARVMDLPLADAQRDLAAQGFKGRSAGDEPHPTAPAGQVVWQDPPPGTLLPPGSPVALTLSSGPALATVPDVAGLEARQARRILGAAGFGAGGIDSVPGGGEAGVVVGTRPGEGTALRPGTPVDLIVTAGPGPADTAPRRPS